MRGSVQSLIILGLMAAGGGYYYYRITAPVELPDTKELARSEAAQVAPAISVTRVKQADFVETAIVSGSLVARDEIYVSPQIEGLRMLELLADVGDKVKKGQVLARLDPEQLNAQMAQNEANIARSAASIAQAQSTIAQTKAQLDESTAQLERAEPLKKSGFLSGATYDQRESAKRSAEAAAQSAKDGLKAAEAEKNQVEAQRRELEWKMANTEVRTPEDGIVSRRTARVGALAIGQADAMFRIIARGEVELDAEVVEGDLAKIKEGQKARVAILGADVDGTVRLISPEVDAATRLGRVRIFLGNNPALRIGGFAEGRIETANSHGLGIPASAITFDSAGSFVLAVVNNKVERRVIQTGLVSNGLVEIKSGLGEGDAVVERAGTFLRDGDTIKPVEAASKVSEAK